MYNSSLQLNSKQRNDLYSNLYICISSVNSILNYNLFPVLHRIGLLLHKLETRSNERILIHLNHPDAHTEIKSLISGMSYNWNAKVAPIEMFLLENLLEKLYHILFFFFFSFAATGCGAQGLLLTMCRDHFCSGCIKRCWGLNPGPQCAKVCVCATRRTISLAPSTYIFYKISGVCYILTFPNATPNIRVSFFLVKTKKLGAGRGCRQSVKQWSNKLPCPLSSCRLHFRTLLPRFTQN